MTGLQNRDEEARAIIARNIDTYVQKRLAYYVNPRLLNEIFKKNPLLAPLKGAVTASEWLNETFLAHESSSEETVMGNIWQQILTELSIHAVGAGDFLFEEGDVLWVLEMKSQKNTLNGGGRAQTLKVLKQRVIDHSQTRSPRRRAVKPAIGILRGPAEDTTRTFIARAPEDREINGFQYRQVVGTAFVFWLTGLNNLSDLVDLAGGSSLRVAREECRRRIQTELQDILAEENLADDFQSIMTIIRSRS